MNAPLDPALREQLERALKEVTLDDKYTLQHGRAFMSGTQALVRLPMLQRERDRRAGLNTAGFISGYRGSPLGGLDQALWKARKHLNEHRIVFQPGLNEEIAATSIWGTQQVTLSPQATADGVFSIWYGKGPGVDRCGDVFKHANSAGSSRYGGVLALAGDDHGAKSSTVPHQSDHAFKAAGMPYFYPATVQEYLDMGLHGWALSRFSGLWVGMKTVTDVVEASASVEVDPDRVRIVLPEDFAFPPNDPDRLNLRWPDPPLEQELRLINYKGGAALAYLRANRLDRVVIDSPHAWFGIATAGKAYLDTLQALEDLGLDRATCERVGIRVFKVGAVWPLEPSGVLAFASGLREVLVVEEKRAVLEESLKEALYDLPDTLRPRIHGKFANPGPAASLSPLAQCPPGWLLPAYGELSPVSVARAIAGRLLGRGDAAGAAAASVLPDEIRARIEARLALMEAGERALREPHAQAVRNPTFCSGCPHNTSTRVPEGSRATAGIGCHYMAIWHPDRNTSTFTQMGGEGSPWIGQAPFTSEKHIFANIGDGTYFHSGILALRASIAAGVNITYKILFNDAVAMTGGQPHDGQLNVPQIVAQALGEGARKVVVVTDDVSRYDAIRSVPPLAGIEIHPREALDQVQRALREIPGCTVLVYDQTCASEKRRRRKKIVDGKPGYPDPAKRVIINEAVCEGCGDCSTQSACVSVEPLETEFGRKRRINQSSCNKDYSCVKGFCPSFVTVEGGSLKPGAVPAAGSAAGAGGMTGAGAVSASGAAASADPALADPAAGVPDPAAPVALTGAEEGSAAPVYGVLVTGIGGTGVITIGQLIGMAAHLEGKGISVLDMAGLAQKGGAVLSHVQISADPEQVHATRIGLAEADLVIGCDLVVTASDEARYRMRKRATRAVVNSNLAPTTEFLHNPDWQPEVEGMRRNVLEAACESEVEFVEANEVAVALLGDAIYTNPLLLGYAWQKGWLPLTREALERAIELNGIAVARNLLAFRWGRRLAHDPEAVRARVRPQTARVIEFKRPVGQVRTAADLDELIARRVDELARYQNAAYAARYRGWVDRVRRVESDRLGTAAKGRLTEAVARYLFKLMAYKDEYEVARLHADPAFLKRIEEQFTGDWTVRFHLAPPLLARIDLRSGRPGKIQFGAWMLPVFRVLARLKFLRGTALDPFGRTAERRTERALIGEYEALVDEILGRLNADNHALAVELARLPEHIRGYGPVKERHLGETRTRWAELLARFRSGSGSGSAQQPKPLRAG